MCAVAVNAATSSLESKYCLCLLIMYHKTFLKC
jgi:hypothetical protein